ncbi:competence/damage-inducible protein A [Flexithrix dorotheae]|uniref:competence/damage-inducible protein A n=1 Tax=Flexithrix dorotheae TaxID=70993 RepID=UPI00035CD0A9|nr:competence/damage-inducible protein A [Flexithrix dorotheae]
MKLVLAEIITIGDEILYGQITDTNSQWISAELDKAGIKTIRKVSIGDQKSEILSAIEEAQTRADIILITGGLGPTKDDITKKTFAEYFGVEMFQDKSVLENIEGLFKARGREINELNQQQAFVPKNARVIMNLVGTAPGMWFEQNGKVMVSMPGVPSEMKKMMSEQIIPSLQEKFETPFILHKMIKTIGIGESKLAPMIEHWEDNLPDHIKLAYLPRMGQVRLRLTAFGTDKQKLDIEIGEQIKKVVPIIGKYIYGFDEEEVEHTIGRLLLQKKQTLATAESCTGGLLADKITDIPGCSAYFKGGIVAYSNEVKMSQLGVLEETLKAHGAVSEQTAMEMAKNVREKYNADYGISTTGIAGPDGGVPGKPVGTIYIGYSDQKETFAKLLNLTQDRHININFTYNAILNLLRKKLMEID